MVSDHIVIRPSLTPDSVFTILAGLCGGGVTVLGEDRDGLAPTMDPDTYRGTNRDANLIVYTSGTTGPPKGVRLTVANLEAASRASMTHLGHGAADIWLLALPLFHVGGLSILVRSVFAGGSVRLLPRFDPESVSSLMRGEVTMVSAVPTMLRRLLDHDPGPYSALRGVLVGGGPIPSGLLERSVAAGLPVLPTYGMTETFGQIATLVPGSPVERKAHPLPSVDVRIESDGRIAVAGPQVSPGYLGEPDRLDRWLVTNDLGEMGSDGALRVLGRADEVIITGGEKVDPSRVEAELLDHPGVEDAIVVGIPDAEWGETVGCLYQGSVGPQDLAIWARHRLAAHQTPRVWDRSDVPRTPLGKPDRQAAVLRLGG